MPWVCVGPSKKVQEKGFWSATVSARSLAPAGQQPTIVKAYIAVSQHLVLPSFLAMTSVCCAVLCCAVLCCAVLCCAVLCCAVLCCAVLCCAVLCCAVLCCAVQRNAVQYGIPLSQGKVVCHTVLCCSVALCSMSRHSMLRCTLSSFGSVLLKSLLSFCTGSRPGSRSLVYFQDVAGGCTLLVTTEGGRQADGAAAEWSANPCFCHGHALGR